MPKFRVTYLYQPGDFEPFVTISEIVDSQKLDAVVNYAVLNASDKGWLLMRVEELEK